MKVNLGKGIVKWSVNGSVRAKSTMAILKDTNK